MFSTFNIFFVYMWPNEREGGSSAGGARRLGESECAVKPIKAWLWSALCFVLEAANNLLGGDSVCGSVSFQPMYDPGRRRKSRPCDGFLRVKGCQCSSSVNTRRLTQVTQAPCATRARPHLLTRLAMYALCTRADFTPQQWPLCHLGLCKFEFEFAPPSQVK